MYWSVVFWILDVSDVWWALVWHGRMGTWCPTWCGYQELSLGSLLMVTSSFARLSCFSYTHTHIHTEEDNIPTEWVHLTHTWLVLRLLYVLAFVCAYMVGRKYHSDEVHMATYWWDCCQRANWRKQLVICYYVRTNASQASRSLTIWQSRSWQTAGQCMELSLLTCAWVGQDVVWCSSI